MPDALSGDGFFIAAAERHFFAPQASKRLKGVSIMNHLALHPEFIANDQAYGAKVSSLNRRLVIF